MGHRVRVSLCKCEWPSAAFSLGTFVTGKHLRPFIETLIVRHTTFSALTGLNKIHSFKRDQCRVSRTLESQRLTAGLPTARVGGSSDQSTCIALEPRLGVPAPSTPVLQRFV